MRLQERSGQYFLTMPKNSIEWLGWHTGDSIEVDLDTDLPGLRLYCPDRKHSRRALSIKESIAREKEALERLKKYEEEVKDLKEKIDLGETKEAADKVASMLSEIRMAYREQDDTSWGGGWDDE